MGLTVRGLDDLLKDFEDLPKIAMDAAEPAMEQTVLFLLGKIPNYPPKPSKANWKGFASDKQRRGFFGLLKSGKIKLPYRRRGGGGLGGSITSDVTRSGTILVGAVGTNKVYAPWVIGTSFPGEVIRGQKMFQARIHEGRWYQLPDVMDRYTDAAFELFEGELEKNIEKLL